MKVKKKTAMLVSFAVGAMLLATTALADITSKSGYEQLKDAVKLTAENSSGKFNSITIDVSYAVKDNGKIYLSRSEVQKYDRINSVREGITENEDDSGGKRRTYWYADKNTSIQQNSGADAYYVTEFTQDKNKVELTNPLKENRAEDIERIADALVGSLKDYVVVTEKPDGSKELSGSLSEVQIPPLVNAVSSFFLKQEFGNYNGQSPRLTQDIFVKSVKGKAVVNKDGVMENILGSAVLSGKDKQGEIHAVDLEFLVKLRDVNATTIVKPDLTGKKVVKQVAGKGQGQEISNPEKFVGKFKNNIILQKDGKFVKVGERIIEITHMDGKTVTGSYHEEYKQGFEQYAGDKMEFKFEGQFNKGRRSADLNVNFPNKSTQIQGIDFDDLGGKVYLNGGYSNMGGIMFDSTFSAALD